MLKTGCYRESREAVASSTGHNARPQPDIVPRRTGLRFDSKLCAREFSYCSGLGLLFVYPAEKPAQSSPKIHLACNLLG